MDEKQMKNYGIDYVNGVSRCLNDENLYRRMLAMFLSDDSFSRSRDAFLRRDYDVLLKTTHELKGVSGNVSLPRIYSASSNIVQYLRSGAKDEKEIEHLFKILEAEYKMANEGISLLMSI